MAPPLHHVTPRDGIPCRAAQQAVSDSEHHVPFLHCRALSAVHARDARTTGAASTAQRNYPPRGQPLPRTSSMTFRNACSLRTAGTTRAPRDAAIRAVVSPMPPDTQLITTTCSPIRPMRTFTGLLRGAGKSRRPFATAARRGIALLRMTPRANSLFKNGAKAGCANAPVVRELKAP